MGTYDEIVLDKAVQIAAKNGWDGDIERSGYAPLVFNKDFARALFGYLIIAYDADGDQVTEPKKLTSYYALPAWKYHLQQMVVADDPLKYLSDNMP